MDFAPRSTGVTEATQYYVAAATTAPAGMYSFTVSATCTNAGHTGGAPGPATFSLAVVTTDLVDKTYSPAVIVTSPKIFHDQVGAEESLYAQVAPSDAQPYMTSMQWSLPVGNGSSQDASYVDSYAQSRTAASYASITSTNVNPMHFFPIAPYNGPGQISLTAQSGTAGTAFHATANMVIDTPTLALDTTPGHVNIGSIATALTPVLIAGDTIENSSGDGIVWDATFTSPSSYVHGQVGMTQLAGANVWSDPSPAPGASAPPEVYQSTGGRYDLDSTPQYGQYMMDGSNGSVTAALSANGTALWRSVDDPFGALKSCLNGVYVEDWFQDYFNFTPDAKTGWTSIPVTIGYSSWFWQAYATRPDGQTDNTVQDWGSPGVWNSPSSTALQSSTALPMWQANAQDSMQGGPAC